MNVNLNKMSADELKALTATVRDEINAKQNQRRQDKVRKAQHVTMARLVSMGATDGSHR